MPHVEKSSPKILHVVISLEVGGAEKLVYDMVRHPHYAANRPVVCCLDEIGELGQKLLQQGCRVYCGRRRSGIDWSMIRWLKEIMEKEQVRVVHAHQYTPLFYSVPAALFCRDVRVIYTEHGRFYPDRKSWKRTLFNPLLAKGVHQLVSISACTARAMATYDNLPLHRIKVIHNGVAFAAEQRGTTAVAKRRELGLDQRSRLIGTAARLNEIKNIAMMLRVFKQVLADAPDTLLLIAGEGPESGKLKALAEEAGIAAKVRFLGLRHDLAEIYPMLEVFLLTSFTEGISVTLLEAMANSVPAVVTDVGGNREVVREGETGYLVPLHDEKAMASRVVELLRDGGKARQFGSRGRESVRAAFAFDSMLDSYNTLYGSI